MQDRIEEIILNHLENVYHNRDALPSLVVKGLAEEIENHRWEIFDYTRKENMMEDIVGVSEELEVELTDEETEYVFNTFWNSDYQDMDSLRDLISNVVYEREKNDSEGGEKEVAM